MVGGVVAYVRKGSVPSLMGSSLVSALFFLAAYMYNSGSTKAVYVALMASGVLTASGLARAIQTNFEKPVPLGLSILGLFSTGYYGFLLL